MDTSPILVTGAAGFIGMHCSARLLAQGHQVIGIDSTAISTGGNLNVKATGRDVEAYLTGNSTSSVVTSSSGTIAGAGVGSHVAGIRGGSLTVGDSITGTGAAFKVIADSALNAKASAITGDVSATAGSPEAEVVGLQSLPISIGKSGSIRRSELAMALFNGFTGYKLWKLGRKA
jgi:NAD(P)-dependent dehydrogenase (short-subunit alcohol dehydrogenase family)